MYPLIIYPLAPSEKTYLILTNVKVEGSYLPTSLHMMSGTTLVILKEGLMTTSPTSSTNRTDALSTSVVVKDAGEGGGHDDESCDREVPVKVGS